MATTNKQNVPAEACRFIASAEVGQQNATGYPLLNDGARGIAKLRAEAREMGLGMSGEGAESARQFSYAMALIAEQSKAITNSIGGAVAPVLTEFSHWVSLAASNVIELVKQNQQLFVTALLVGEGILLAGTALIKIGAIATGLGSMFGLLSTAVTGLGTAMGAVVTTLGLILSPIGLVAVGLAGLASYFIATSETGQQAMSALGEVFGNLTATARTAFQGIADAISAGDIVLAGQIMWAGLKAVFKQGFNFLEGVWIAFKGFFVEAFASAFRKVSLILVSGWSGLQMAWIEFTSFLLQVWAKVCNSFANGWDNTVTFVARRLLEIQGLIDPNLDVAGAKKELDDANERKKAQRNNAARRELEQMQADAKARIDAIAAKDGKQHLRDAVNKKFDEEKSAREREREALIAAGAAEVKAAQDELNALRDRAAKAKQAIGEKQIVAPNKPVFDPGEIAGATAAAKARISSTGTFSSNLSGLGIGKDLGEQQLDEQKKANGFLQAIKEKMPPPLVFGQ